MWALLVSLIPFPCAGGAAGDAFPALGGAVPQLLQHGISGQKRVWWESTVKSCSVCRELWNGMGAEDHSPETSPGSMSSQCKYPLDPQPLGYVQCVLSR